MGSENVLRPEFRAIEAGDVISRHGPLDVLADRPGVLFAEQVFVPDDLLDEAVELLTRLGLRR